uniref:Protein kinase domain-containing protein n=1 Tax=Oryza punctata TaxID=4537 RepID=A0A0E0MGB5_ORYPU
MELLKEKNITHVSQRDDKAKWIIDNYSNIRSFTEHDIEKITSNYSTLIGKGGFGEVFKGVLDDEHVVAVKRYIRGDLREEFMEEVRIHAQMSHKNIVKLIGCCIGKNRMMMVTEFVSNGNLEDALHNSDISIPLSTRLGIAIGCAEALSYMHSMHLSSRSLICHGDIKPGNILLDANLTAKVSDFGISKSLSGGITRWTSNVKGSIAYMDPIYYREGRVTSKSDVYSFGVVLLELIARKSMKEGGISCEAFRQACAKGKGLRELLDIEIAEECNMNILEEIAKLATKCMIVDNIKKRPQMNDVAEHLRTWIFEVRNGGHEKAAWELTLKILQNAVKKGYMHSAGIFSSSLMSNPKKQNFGIFRSNDVRFFTKEDLSGITRNKSHLLGKGAFCDVYKGTLDDNTLVAVKMYSEFSCDEHLRDSSISTSTTIMSQIAHKYIIKLLGCCFDADLPILIYEYAAKGSLNDILYSKEDFSLELRLKIAVKTAEALEFLHSSAFCVIRHGNVNPSNILLDSNLMPKVAGFTSSRRLAENNNYQVAPMEFSHIHYMDPIHVQSGHLTVKNDVYSFGVVLLELISRKKPVYHYHDENRHLIPEFIRAYETAKSGKVMFDEGIMAEEDIDVLEEIGRLAMECVRLEIDERPTMKEVAERLKMIRTMKESSAMVAARC